MAKFTQVTSSQNTVLKEIRELLKTPRESTIIFGLKLFRQFLQLADGTSQDFKLKTLLIPSARADLISEFSQFRFQDPVTRLEVADALFKEVDQVGTRDIIAVFSAPELKPIAQLNIFEPAVVLATQNPANLGACLRSIQLFGIKQVILCEEAAYPHNYKVLRSSVGANFCLKFFAGPKLSALGQFESSYILDMNGQDLAKTKFQKNSVFIFGEEGRGVPADLSVRLKASVIQIPMPGKTESGPDSLNVAVACGITLATYAAQFSGIKTSANTSGG